MAFFFASHCPVQGHYEFFFLLLYTTNKYIIDGANKIIPGIIAPIQKAKIESIRTKIDNVKRILWLMEPLIANSPITPNPNSLNDGKMNNTGNMFFTICETSEF